MLRTCKCCGEPAPWFGAADFAKSGIDAERGPVLPPAGWSVDYFRCRSCGFLFSDFLDDWSQDRLKHEIYNEDYLRFDPEFAGERPERTAGMLEQLFGAHKTSRILDYGGGDGALTRRLRARGFTDVHSLDPFHGDAAPVTGRFDVMVCVEVFEHLTRPDAALAASRTLLKPEGVLIFSTQLQPYDIGQCGTSWWYLAPRNGHVSLHSRRSLEILARRHGLSFGSFNPNLHMAWQRLPDFAAYLAVYAQPGAPALPEPDAAARHASLDDQARAEPLLALLRRIVPSGGVVIDANAAGGAIALGLADVVGARGTVVAYEPRATHFGALAAAVADRRASGVVMCHAALGDRWGSTWLAPLDGQPARIRPVVDGDTPQRIRIETIDALGLTHLDLIRLDVAGLERTALQGAALTIGRLRPALCVANARRELSPELIGTIQAFGYRLWWHFTSRGDHADAPAAAHMICLSSEHPAPAADLIPVTGRDAWWI